MIEERDTETEDDTARDTRQLPGAERALLAILARNEPNYAHHIVDEEAS